MHLQPLSHSFGLQADYLGRNRGWVGKVILQVVLGVAVLGWCGCASPIRKGGESPDPSELAKQLNALVGGAAPEESALLADVVVQRSIELAHDYRSVRPAWFHNFLIHAGVRERGLCWQWAEDLTVAIYELELSSFAVHQLVARFDTAREHNAVGISGMGQSFADGLVLDPWRKSGYLVWPHLREDTYPWYKRVPKSERDGIPRTP